MRISPNTLELVMTLRDAIEQDGGTPASIAQELAKLPDFEGAKATAGYHVTPEGDIVDDHWWLMMDDGSVFDPSGDAPVRCSKKDLRHCRYFPYTGETGIPMKVLQAADHIKAKSRLANNKSFSELATEASGASASSAVARQAPESLPDAVTAGGVEGVPVEEFDDETKPEDLQMGWEDLVGEDDGDHADALRRTGFWGNAGAGVLFKARDTGRILFAHRSDAVEEPNTWGTWGGAIDDGEQPMQAAMREVQEETGHKPNRNDIVPMYVFKHPSGFQYFNFLVYTDTEFDPRLNWETQGSEWVEFGDFPEPLHPGAISLLNDSKSADLLAEQPELREVDHPDYMPGGESASDNVEPTFDDRSVQTNAGWPSP